MSRELMEVNKSMFMIIFCAGFLMCKQSTQETSQENTHLEASKTNSGQPKFVLFIFNNNEQVVDLRPEYQAWLKTISPEHNAEWIYLSDTGWTLTPGQGGAVATPGEYPGSGDVGSYLIFEAKNPEEALTIAKSCPRLNSKSTIELRQVR